MPSNFPVTYSTLAAGSLGDLISRRYAFQKVSAWINGLGYFEVVGQDTFKKDSIKIRPDYSWIDKSVFGEELAGQLQQIQNAQRRTEHFYISRIPGVGNPVFTNEQPFGGSRYREDALRLLCLYRYWNMIQYFFPYKDLIGEDWNDVLNEFVPKFWRLLMILNIGRQYYRSSTVNLLPSGAVALGKCLPNSLQWAIL